MRTRQLIGGGLAMLLCGTFTVTVASGKGEDKTHQGQDRTHPPGSTRPVDQDLARAIEKDLHDAAYADLDDVRVDVREGVATLTGEVESTFAREEAMRTARAYRGIDRVVDRLSMAKESERSDAQIESDLERMMQKHPHVDRHDIEVDARDGVVTLTGRTDNPRDRRLANDLAESVAGVRRVDNEIQVERSGGHAGGRDDHEIRDDIQRQIDRRFGATAADVDVDVQGGKIDLDGSVPSSSVRNEVIALTWVPGVTEVVAEDLKIDLAPARAVAPGAARGVESDVRYAATRSGDAFLQQAISDAYDEEPVLDRLEPAVRVEGGVVYLTGDVESESAQARAEEIARGIPGVVRVQNNLRVRGTSREAVEDLEMDDDAIHDRVEKELFDGPLFERNQIRVHVDEGVVRLTGRVWSERERAAAEDIVRGVAGVRDVKNDLTVSN